MDVRRSLRSEAEVFPGKWDSGAAPFPNHSWSYSALLVWSVSRMRPARRYSVLADWKLLKGRNDDAGSCPGKLVGGSGLSNRLCSAAFLVIRVCSANFFHLGRTSELCDWGVSVVSDRMAGPNPRARRSLPADSQFASYS